jgi:hypothetical protein
MSKDIIELCAKINATGVYIDEEMLNFWMNRQTFGSTKTAIDCLEEVYDCCVKDKLMPWARYSDSLNKVYVVAAKYYHAQMFVETHWGNSTRLVYVNSSDKLLGVDRNIKLYVICKDYPEIEKIIDLARERGIKVFELID